MKKPILGSAGCVLFVLLMAATEGKTGPQNVPRTDAISPPSSSMKIDADFGRSNPDRKILEPQALKESANRGSDALERWVVKLEFVGANEHVKPIGEAETDAVVSYLKGKAEDWHTGLPTYSRILYRHLWPGIDLVYYGTVNKLKYEFIVHPGADPAMIRLAYRGVENVSVDENGRLQVTTPAGGFSDDVPVAYQEICGEKVDISLSYKLTEADRLIRTGKDCGIVAETQEFIYGFEIGDYDHSLPIVLDPAILTYCGYIGGSDRDEGNGIAVGGSGNAYVAGRADSTEATFPGIVGPDLTHNGDIDAFVAKVYYFEQPVHKHAVGDFDGDGSDEVAMDFEAGGPGCGTEASGASSASMTPNT